MKWFLVLFFLVLILLQPFSNSVFAKENSGSKKRIQKTLSSFIGNTYIDINNLKALESNNGFSDYNLNSNLEGMEFPKGSNKFVVFQSGLLWGGFVKGDNQVRVGGSAYRSGLQAGPILSNGQAAPNPATDPRWRIYRVRPDIYPGGPNVDLTNEAQLEGTSTSALRSQYEEDWTEWPAKGTSNDLGAPFTDVNGDGIYEPNIDIPGVHGADQTVYYVANDLDSMITSYLYGTNPLGLEVHATYWAYNQGGALGNVYFKKYTLINKGYQHNQIDSMFISLWADPDLGNANDDLVGTDTALNLIYTYNGGPVDAVYTPDTPPSVGFSLLEGPIVNGNSTDTALYNGNKLAGKKNLPMTASYFFINSDVNFGDPPQGTPIGSTQFYHFFNGQYGLSALPYLNPTTNLSSKYVFTGDPVAGSGWIDGIVNPPSDRRQGISSGPFTMMPGDTQEVVFAEIVGEGIDYLHSIYTVKEYQYYASNAFKNLLNKVETPSPTPPAMTLSNNNNSIQILWDNSAEGFDKLGYFFEGYNVYQLSSALDSKESAKLIATFDKIDGIKTIYGQAINPQTDQMYNQIQQSGNDAGLQYSFTATRDYINNVPFIKGKNYYFVVSAYTFNLGTDVDPNNTESLFQPENVAYNYNLPGPNYGDTVQVTHVAGKSDGSVIVKITDPSKLTGHSYKVLFDTLMTATIWGLKDITTNSVLITKQPINTSQIIDGFQITVTGSSPGMNSGGQGEGWNIPTGTRRFTWAGNSLAGSYGLEGFSGTIGWSSPDYLYNTGKESVPASALCNTLLTLAQVRDTALFDPVFPSSNDVNLSFGYRYLRRASSPAAESRFAPHIIHASGGTYPFQEFAQTIPMSAWNVDDPSHPDRLTMGYLENNVSGGLVDGKYWPPDYTQVDQVIAREFLWIFQAPYSTSVNPNFEVDALGSNPLPVMWFIMWERRGPVPFSPDQTGEDQFLIIKNNPFTMSDEFTFNTSQLTDVKTKEVITKYSLNQNYPNPFNPTTRIDFSLPKTEHVTLKIYDILGRQITTLVNEERPTGIYSIEFNASKLASGVYFYRMQAGSFVETKKLILMK